MISPYRLGDLIAMDLDNDTKQRILTEFPNSFGSKFIQRRKNGNTQNSIDLITTIVTNNIKKYEHLLPPDIAECCMVHLRLGDVVAGHHFHETGKRPFEINYIKSLLEKNEINCNVKKYVIGKCFFASPSSRNYDECITASNKYLKQVLDELDATHFDSGVADIDLCCAVRAKVFVQGRGFYSKLIVDIRNKLGLRCIETKCYD